MILSLLLGLARIASAGGFSGDWITSFGQMTLESSSGSVRGTYHMGADLCRIEGKEEGGVLTFTYSESDADGEGAFTLAPDGKSFTGRWRQRGNSAWNPWKGVRPGAGVSLTGFDGLWQTSFGRLRLTEDAGKVRGAYTFGNGTLEGSVKGSALAFRYKDAAQGDGEFTLSADGWSFSGRWRADGETEWKPWEGRRVQPVPGRRWLYVIEARWEGNIAEPEYTYGEMLRAFFTRMPTVQVRQRFFTNGQSLAKWLREAAFLGEPVVVYLSSHGTDQGLSADDGPAGADVIADALKDAPDVRLLHFGACDVMKGGVPASIHERLGKAARFPISGFTEPVDWAASAIADFMYLDFILARDFEPEAAAEETARLLPFVNNTYRGAPFGKLGFKMRKAPSSL